MKTIQIGTFFLLTLAATVLPQPCSAQNGVIFGIGYRGQSRHGGQHNFGLWREGSPATGVIAREFGSTLTNLAPYVVPVIQSLTAAPLGNLINPTGGDNESADRENCGEIEIKDNDPNFEQRGQALIAIQKRQDSLFKKLGISDYEPQLKPVQDSSANSNTDIVAPTETEVPKDNLPSPVKDN